MSSEIALIFDLDGTLIDSRPDLALSVNSMLKEYNLPTFSEEQIGDFIGDGTPKLAERALRAAGALENMEDPSFDRYFETLLHYYQQNIANKTRIYPGVGRVLQQFEHLPMAVVTNKPAQFTGPTLAAFGLDKYFSFVAGGDTFEKRKPDPFPIREAIRSLEADPDSTIIVGDGDTDIEAGKAAGITTVAALYGYRPPDVLRQLNPDYAIESFAELPVIIHEKSGTDRVSNTDK